VFDGPQRRKRHDNGKLLLKKIVAVCFWLIVWAVLSLIIAEPVLLPSPLAVLKEFFIRMATGDFWLAALTTFGRILIGFLLAFLFGNILALPASFNLTVRVLLLPPVAVMKSTPVASIILLLLIWFRPAALPLIVAILLVFPIVYTNVLEGIASVDRELLEMADCFGFGLKKKLQAIYIPALRPALLSSAKLGTSISFKAAVAAEVIAVPFCSFGSMIYEAKIHLDSAGMFAVTAAVVMLGGLFETFFCRSLNALLTKLEKPKIKMGPSSNPAINEVSSDDIALGGAFCDGTAICLEDVTFAYESAAMPLFDQFSCKFKAGGRTLISGPSGSGKTTLLSLILGRLSPSRGRIFTIVDKCAVVFQEDRLLLHLTAEENLAFVSGDFNNNQLILSELGLEGKTNKPTGGLSGGERRRVALARALACEAPLLILDEPLRSLDPALAEQVAEVIRKKSIGRTVIETGHEVIVDRSDTSGESVYCDYIVLSRPAIEKL
jgi:NitT/TauT family transport system permease protein